MPCLNHLVENFKQFVVKWCSCIFTFKPWYQWSASGREGSTWLDRPEQCIEKILKSILENINCQEFWGILFAKNIIWCSSELLPIIWVIVIRYHPCSPWSGPGQQIWEGWGRGSRRGSGPGGVLDIHFHLDLDDGYGCGDASDSQNRLAKS